MRGYAFLHVTLLKNMFLHQRKSLSISLAHTERYMDYLAIISKRQSKINFDWKSVNLNQKEMGTQIHTHTQTHHYTRQGQSIDRSILW